MGKKTKNFGIGLVVFAIAASAAWWAMGPNWRSLLLHLPTDRNILFWSQSQREISFRMTDKLSFLAKSNKIEMGEKVRDLPEGAPLDLPMDMDAYVEAQNLAGLVILHDGKVRYEQYGLGFKPDERWTSFSVAKSFTSTLVGAAIHDGYIESLDDKVSKYVSGLEGSPYDDVTLTQLLTMTSGVAWNEDYEDPQSDVALFANYEADDDLPLIVSYMRTLERAHPPGEKWHYSTGETNLIGILVSEATGKPLATYLSEKVWAPFGMQQNATWLLGGDGIEMSGCCLQAATRDFARFGQYVLEDGVVDGIRTVPEGWFAAASSRYINADRFYETADYGYQWWVDPEPITSFRAGGIFGQGILIDPHRNLVIASNSNWTSALGLKDGERDRRLNFYRTVQVAVDAEAIASE